MTRDSARLASSFTHVTCDSGICEKNPKPKLIPNLHWQKLFQNRFNLDRSQLISSWLPSQEFGQPASPKAPAKVVKEA